MKQAAPVNKTVKIGLVVTAIIIALVPFHALLTVWLSSLIGHYTLLRLWKEFLLLPVLAAAVYKLVKNREIRSNFLRSWIARLVALYSLLLIVCGAAAWTTGGVNGKALFYGLLVDLRFLIFFLAVAVLAAGSEWLLARWQKLLFVPAIFVAAFAVLQYMVLPYDFLKNLGYGRATIYPYETINHNIHHLRVISTLRGANPLGAYLILPLCALAVGVREKRARPDRLIFGAGLLLALFFSFSRSAWIGAALGIFTAAWLSLRSDQARRRVLWAAAAVIAVGAVAAISLRNNLAFQDTVLHTDRQSTALQSSNQGHSAAFKSAVKDVVHHPLGSGTGTAGPQSVYNNHPGRIAENYYLQIGQESGVIGMVMFIAIIVLVARMLYARREDPLSAALLAALIGLSIVNLLSHAWEDDTLAYVYWGLAGIAYAPIIGLKAINGAKKQNSPQTRRPVR